MEMEKKIKKYVDELTKVDERFANITTYLFAANETYDEIALKDIMNMSKDEFHNIVKNLEPVNIARLLYLKKVLF